MILKIKGKSCGLVWGIGIIAILFIAVINPSVWGASSPQCDWRACMMPNIWNQCVSYCEPGLSCCNGICYNPSYSICCSDFTCSITSHCCGSSHCCSQGWQCCPDGCCPDGYSCCGEHCCNSDLCQECVNGQCQVCSGDLYKECCNGACCNLLDCKICFEGNCISYCDQENCEECNDGHCRVCGNREYEACCGGQCYDIRTHKCCTDSGSPYICENEKICCNGSCCNPLDCKICFEGNCISDCDEENCEECVNGECKVCGGDPTKCCLNGECKKCCNVVSKGYCEAEENNADCGCASPAIFENCTHNKKKWTIGQQNVCFSECGGLPCSDEEVLVNCYAWQACKNGVKQLDAGCEPWSQCQWIFIGYCQQCVAYGNAHIEKALDCQCN